MLSALGNFLLGVPNPYVQRRAQDEAINIGVRAGNTAINLGERAVDGLTRRALYIIDSLAILGISYSSLNMGSALNYDYKVCVLQTDGYCAPQLAGTVFFVAIPVILAVQHIKFTKNPVSQTKVQEQETQTDPEEPQSQPQLVVEELPSLIQQRLLIEDRRVLEDLLEISDENITDDQIFQKLLDVYFPIQHVQSFRNRASRVRERDNNIGDAHHNPYEDRSETLPSELRYQIIQRLGLGDNQVTTDVLETRMLENMPEDFGFSFHIEEVCPRGTYLGRRFIYTAGTIQNFMSIFSGIAGLIKCYINNRESTASRESLTRPLGLGQIQNCLLGEQRDWPEGLQQKIEREVKQIIIEVSRECEIVTHIKNSAGKALFTYFNGKGNPSHRESLFDKRVREIEGLKNK